MLDTWIEVELLLSKGIPLQSVASDSYYIPAPFPFLHVGIEVVPQDDSEKDAVEVLINAADVLY